MDHDVETAGVGGGRRGGDEDGSGDGDVGENVHMVGCGGVHWVTAQGEAEGGIWRGRLDWWRVDRSGSGNGHGRSHQVAMEGWRDRCRVYAAQVADDPRAGMFDALDVGEDVSSADERRRWQRHG